jgi:hypothetical protein
MKNIVKIAVIGALIALGIAQSNAGILINTTNYVTNIVVKARMTVFATAFQDGDTRVRLNTRDVLINIADELDITLDGKARLELVHILNSTDDSGNTTPLQGTWRIRLINGATTMISRRPLARPMAKTFLT